MTARTELSTFPTRASRPMPLSLFMLLTKSLSNFLVTSSCLIVPWRISLLNVWCSHSLCDDVKYWRPFGTCKDKKTRWRSAGDFVSCDKNTPQRSKCLFVLTECPVAAGWRGPSSPRTSDLTMSTLMLRTTEMYEIYEMMTVSNLRANGGFLQCSTEYYLLAVK